MWILCEPSRIVPEIAPLIRDAIPSASLPVSRSMPTLPTTASEERTSHPVFTALHIFGRVVLLLMAVAIAYAAWMMIKNWSAVGV